MHQHSLPTQHQARPPLLLPRRTHRPQIAATTTTTTSSSASPPRHPSLDSLWQVAQAIGHHNARLQDLRRPHAARLLHDQGPPRRLSRRRQVAGVCLQAHRRRRHALRCPLRPHRAPQRKRRALQFLHMARRAARHLRSLRRVQGPAGVRNAPRHQSTRLIIKHLRSRAHQSAFRALLVSSNLGRPLRGKDDVPGGVKRLRNPPLIGRGTRPFEHPLLSRLFRALTRRERWDEVESILDLAAFAYAPDGSGAQLTELSEEEHLPPTSSGRRSSKQKAMEERFVPGRLHRAPGVDAIGVSAAATLAQVTSIRSRIKNLSRCSSSILTDQAR